jgi:lysyl-tRNA synthetase class I
MKCPKCEKRMRIAGVWVDDWNNPQNWGDIHRCKCGHEEKVKQ